MADVERLDAVSIKMQLQELKNFDDVSCILHLTPSSLFVLCPSDVSRYSAGNAPLASVILTLGLVALLNRT